ncbi:unnamed protein product, partial [Symbiodinium sp. KB8]
EDLTASRWSLADVSGDAVENEPEPATESDVVFPDQADNAESSCEDVLVDQPRPMETIAAAFGRSFAVEADATQGLLDEDDLPTCARFRLPLQQAASGTSGPPDRHLALVDDVASLGHQLQLMAMRLDTQESLIDWLKDRDREAMEEKMRLLTMLRTQAAVLDEQKQQISALSELVSRLRDDFYGQAIARSLARSRSPPVDRAARTPITPPTYQVPHDFQSEGDGTLEVKKRRTECSDWKAGAIAFKVVRRKADVSWEDQRSKEHDRALARWRLVISRWDDCWPDLEIVKAMASIPDNERRKDSLLDWLHPRAPATLIKRVNSILLYHKEVGWGQDVVPYREHSVYCYMRDAKAGGAKPSQLSSLREALIFVRFVFDVPSLDTIVKSRRILGITRRGAKRGRTKAHPLRVCDLEVLHTILESADSAWDKLFSGACLACLYMRARWSDFQHTCAFSIDYSDEHEPVYLEFRAEVFKTMNAKFFDGEPMIWVAPAQGIYRHNWVKLWMQVRQELELESFQPPLPVPREGGGATAGAVLTGEITAWLQRVLPGREGLRTTAHSLKRTCLSWANKRGFDPRDKLILGGHAHDAPMVDRYGDDFAARPLRLLEELLSEIRSGAFRPDASRAGRLVTVQGSSEVHDSLPGSWAEVSDPVSIPVPDEECDEDVASPDSPNMSCLNAEEDFGCDQIFSAAMALVDSEAAFAQRCKEVDAEGLRGQLAAQGLTTFAKLAYACGTPQEKPTSAEFEAFTGRVLGAAPRLGDVSLLKRLMFEAATFVIAQLKQAVQAESSETPRRLPAAEKAAREVEQRTRLAGVNIERELVPSHALIDLCHNMVELNSVTWISPSKCTSRESEIQLSTRDQSKVFKLEDHTLKVSSDMHKGEADYSSPLKLQWCLQRRGLALDQCKLMSWSAHEKWVRTLLQSMTRDCPADFTRPNIAQIVQADREAFLIMAAELRDLRPSVDGSFPMSVALDALRTDPRITMFLMAMPFKRSVAVDADRPPTPPGAAAAAKTRRQNGLLLIHLGVLIRLTKAEALEGVRPFASLYFFPSVPDAADRFPCGTEAESLAVTCLLDGHINYEQLRLLIEMLPGENPARASGQPVPVGEPAKSFTTGAYVYSDVCGLRANARCFPATSMLLASIVSAIFPHDSVSAVALFRNIATPLHSDDNNELGCDNLLIPCSHFENGQVWIEGTGSVPCPLDPTLSGSLLETSGGPAQFNARLRHATCGWTGLRLMLVAFQEHDLNMLLDIIRQERAEIALVHLAPPCGTASAARSVQYPMGLPELQGQDLLRVTAANTLYAAVGQIVQVATSFGIRVTVENPANSLAWLCDGMYELLFYPGASEVLFDHCMHGGTRDKCTRWWCNDHFFDSLALRCSKDHPHASWKPRFNTSGIDFPTHHEAAYPSLLCERIASLLADAHSEVSAMRPRPATQVFLDKQPRYARPLVSNYAGYDTWAVPLSRDSWADLILPLYPKGCKVLRRKLVPWGRVRVCAKSVCPMWDEQAIASWNVTVKLAESDQHCDMDFDSSCEEAATHKVVALIFPNECRPTDDMVELLCFGIPREPDDFVRHAVMAGHPRNLLQDAVDGPAKTVAECVLVGKQEREQLVDKTVATWKSIKEGCAADNAKLLLQGPDHVRKVLANKNVLFWRDILNLLDFADVDLWRDLRQGFRLTGWMPASGVFPKRLRPPALTKDELLAQSAYRTPLTVSSIAKGAKDDVARAAWSETKAEIEKGWIFLDSSYDPLRIILSRRFGLQQRDKTRVIDDGKASGLNLLCGLIEHFTLHGVDVIAATLICLLKIARERKGRLLSFSTSVSALGLVFDLSEFSKGNVTIRHTERRAQELRDTLEYHLGRGTLSPKEAEVLRGRLHWYSSYLFGRGPAVAMKILSRRAQGREGSNFVNDELRGALSKLLDHVENAPPLRINVASERTFFLFTDGSYEPSSDVAAGIGGILYDDAGLPVSFFSGSVHPDDLDAMLETSSHPIYEIELYAVLAAFRCWGHLLKRMIALQMG